MWDTFAPRTRRGVSIAFVMIVASAGVSYAQTEYPEKPVRIILPYGPGGVADVTTRLVAGRQVSRLCQG